MLNYDKIVRETPLERYQEIFKTGSFNDTAWIARRKVSNYWRIVALMARKKYIDLNMLFSLTQNTIKIYIKLHEISHIPNDYYSEYDLYDVNWLFKKWEKWKSKNKAYKII